MSWSTPIRVFEGRDPYGSTLFYSNDKLWLFWLDEYGDDDKIYVSSSINGIDWNNQIILNGNFYGPDLDFNINPNGVFKINYWQSGYKTLISESGTSWESYPSDSSTAISNYYSNISLESNSFYWEFKGYNEFSISKNGINWSDPIDMRVRTNNQTCHLQYLFQDNDGTYLILGVYYGLYNEKDEYIRRLVIQSFNIVSWNTPNPADNPSLNNDSLIDGKERRSYFPTFILIIISIIFIILLTIVIIKKRGEES